VAIIRTDGRFQARASSAACDHGEVMDQYLMRAWLAGAPAEGYPWGLPAVRALAGGDGLEFHKHVTYLVGENGSGKSTVLEALAVALGFNPEGGTRNFNFATRETHSPLHDRIRTAHGRRAHHGFFFRAESFYNVATEIEALGVERYYGGRSLHARSHGEAFLELARHRFATPGLYFLDEPEAALSPARQLTILSILHQAVRDGAQFVIATHSPILMSYPSAWIYALDQEGFQRAVYDQTEPVKITRLFLESPERMLRHLFAED
jgi:predicted ATPase